MSRRRCSRAGALVIAVASLAAGCAEDPAPHVLLSRHSPDGRQRAEVRVTRCAGDWCQSLWSGAVDAGVAHIATLTSAGERCGEIAWTPDGGRVAFLVNGHELRLYDARTLAPAGLVGLVPADGPPTSRIARGVSFSGTGAAVTFDDCPRDRSGCRPGIVALR
jgi:hypothetical protein